ncbi:MAG: hypothetical protein ACOX6X_05065 [Dethiobacteria bacterium]
MRKATVLFLMLLIVLACVTAAMCYSAAVVHSPAVLKVVSTNEALLALIPAEDLAEAGRFCTIEDGVLYFDFSGGEGLPANSEWQWPHLFTVKNNSAETVNFAIKNMGIPYLNLEAREPGSSSETGIVMVVDGENKDNYASLFPGETASIAVSFNIKDESPVFASGTLSVISVAE